MDKRLEGGEKGRGTLENYFLLFISEAHTVALRPRLVNWDGTSDSESESETNHSKKLSGRDLSSLAEPCRAGDTELEEIGLKLLLLFIF